METCRLIRRLVCPPAQRFGCVQNGTASAFLAVHDENGEALTWWRRNSNDNFFEYAAPAGREPPSFGIGQFLFVVVLVVILFLLGQGMVRHRFHEGGRVHRNGSTGQ
jgi:hypothetical protein